MIIILLNCCDTIVRTRLSQLVLLSAIRSPVGPQFPYVDIDWLHLCVRSNQYTNQQSVKPSSIRNFGMTPCTVLESRSACRNLVGILAHVSIYITV